MKKNNYVTGSFFSLILIIIIGILLLNLIYDDGTSGLGLKSKVTDLKDRISLHYALKNTKSASDYMSNYGKQYIHNREIVPSEDVKLGLKNAESGSANIVTSIVVDYRGFDTLGEVTVLFVSIIGVSLLLFSFGAPVLKEPSMILNTGALFLMPIIMLTGVYIFVHGHLTPGGGFPGGAVIATGFLLMILGFKEKFKSKKVLKITESLAGIMFVAVGMAGYFIKGSFLANFMGNGIVGSLFSAGFVMVIYIFIGIKVSAELSSGIKNIYNGEEDDR